MKRTTQREITLTSLRQGLFALALARPLEFFSADIVALVSGVSPSTVRKHLKGPDSPAEVHWGNRNRNQRSYRLARELLVECIKTPSFAPVADARDTLRRARKDADAALQQLLDKYKDDCKSGVWRRDVDDARGRLRAIEQLIPKLED